jgi:hypothetical protein
MTLRTIHYANIIILFFDVVLLLDFFFWSDSLIVLLFCQYHLQIFCDNDLKQNANRP